MNNETLLKSEKVISLNDLAFNKDVTKLRNDLNALLAHLNINLSELYDIITLAQENENLSKLVELLSSADLVTTVQEASSLTVLAPLNSAFDKIKEVLPTLDAATVKDILLSHVVDGSVLSSALNNGLEVSTLGSLKLTVEINDEGVFFKAPGSTAKVVTADIEAKNGVVHLLDTVLLPS